MHISILDFVSMVNHVPREPTYVLRINSKRHPLQLNFLEEYALHTVREYFFDDVDSEEHAIREIMHLLTEEEAETIVRDFQKDGLDKPHLIVHCTEGKNRAPAVALALNELFRLGRNFEEIRARYGELNQYVYRTVLQAGKRIL